VLATNTTTRFYAQFTPQMVIAYLGLGADPDQGPPWAVVVAFNEQGAALLEELTRKNSPSRKDEKGTTTKRHLAILLNNVAISAPTINSQIGTHAQITGDFTRGEVDGLMTALRSPALLEFCILANSEDDKPAIDDAMQLINSGAPDVNKALKEAAANG